MKWEKKGLIFVPNNNFEWMKSHAAPPVCDFIDDKTIRIYFASRDNKGRSRPSFIEVDAEKPQEIKYIHNRPILELGKLGTFDDNGIMPSWIVNDKGKKWLYYIGWNPQKTVSYKLAIGIAVSRDGIEFKKYSEGPICDRSIYEPYFNTAPCVIKEDGLWKMWYVSCFKWGIVNKWPEPYYDVKYTTSSDGINWKKTGITCIKTDNKFRDAVGKPCVYKENDIYKMIYSYRNAINYRTDPNKSYRLGYAESKDGVKWTIKDDEIGISFNDGILYYLCFQREKIFNL
jgi:predicted GH43/DUF377 family glycosyl hydrolase